MRVHIFPRLLGCMVLLALALLWSPSHSHAAAVQGGGRWQTFSAENGLAGNSVQAIWQDPQGRVWFGTENGVSRYDGRSWQTYRVADGLLDNNVWSISGDADTVWCATNSGLSALRNGTWQNYTTRDGLPGNDVRAVLAARDGTVWAGTFGSGIGVWRPGANRWDHYDLSALFPGRGVFVQSIWQAPDRAIWFSTNSLGALRLDATRLEKFSFRTGSRNTVWAVGAADSASTWLGTFRGIVQVTGNQVRVIDDIVQGVTISETEVLAVAGGRGSDDMWFGTRSHGVLHRVGRTWEQFTTRDGLGGNYVQSALVDREGRVWFGTRGGGVTLFDPQPLASSALQATVSGQDVQAGLPVALGHGPLDHRQNNLQFTFALQAPWLPPQDVSFRYWLEQKGVSSSSAIKIVHSPPTSPIAARSDVLVDLRPGSYALHVVPSVGDSTGPESVVAFNIRSAPPAFRADTPTVTADGRAVDRGLTLPSVLFGSARQVQLAFAAADDATPEDQLHYRYRIGGLSEPWQDAEGDHATITLPQGIHTVVVEATDGDNNRSAPVTISVIVPPPLWKSVLFYLLLVLLPSALSGVVGALGYRRWARHQALVRAVQGYVIPYDVGSLITVPDRYIGRQHVLDTILGKLDNNNFYIYGEKRIGKTSMLLQLKGRLEQRNDLHASCHYIPVFRNIQDLPQDQFWFYLARSIIAEVPNPPPDLLAYDGHPTNYDDLDAEGDLELLVGCVQRNHSRPPCIVLLLDEVDTLQHYAPAILQRFRAFCQHTQGSLRVVLTGVLPPGGHDNETSPWYNIFERITLGPLEQPDVLHLIRSYNHNPYAYTSDAEHAILAAGDSKPFDTQWLCSEAVKAMLAAHRTTVTLAAVDQATDAVVGERAGEYAACWQRLASTLQEQIMTTLPDGQLDEITDSRACDHLILAGLALRTDGGYRLTNLFRRWLEGRVVMEESLLTTDGRR